MSQPTYKLWYWIRGYPFDSVQLIEAPSNTTVAALKVMVASQVINNQVCAVDLHFHRVLKTCTLSLVEEYESSLGELSISKLGLPMRAAVKLESIFMPQPQENHLHLIVTVDQPLQVTCWVQGAGVPLQSINVQLPKHVLPIQVISTVKESLSALADIPTSALKLYTLSNVNDDELKEAVDYKRKGGLVPMCQMMMKDAFNDVPFSSWEFEAFIEVVSHQGFTRALPSSRCLVGEGVIVLCVRQKFLKDNTTEKPSAAATPSSFTLHQANAARAIPCGRPRDCKDHIPTTLLHPVFCQFIEDTKTIGITAEDNKFGLDLACAMSALYPNEHARVDKIHGVLENHGIHLNITKTKTGFQTDGDISTQGHRYVIAEFKNEAGGTSAEPYFQALRYYLESTRQDAPKMTNSPLPCLLLSIFGPYIVFAGAAWNRRPTVQVLSMPIAFHIDTTDTPNFNVLVRYMAAFRRAIQTLKQYYETLRPPPSLTTSESSSQLFLYPVDYISWILGTKGEANKVVYERQLPDKLVFFGFENSQTGPRICIKFTQRYSTYAHDYCTSLGCAPRLRGFEILPGSWYMVIMDDVSEEFTTLFTKRLEGFSGTPNLKTRIAEKLEEFHRGSFVHGDIRDTNIMVPKQESDQGFMILDFDWGGVANDAVYPECVNKEDMWRPDGAIDGLPILAAHDMDMLFHIPD